LFLSIFGGGSDPFNCNTIRHNGAIYILTILSWAEVRRRGWRGGGGWRGGEKSVFCERGREIRRGEVERVGGSDDRNGGNETI
jgi:hypothetical protein